MPVVYGGDPVPLAILALELGGHVRVGIGDYPHTAEGAPSNAQLVARVVTLARALGREPATSDEARETWGINTARAGRQ